MDYSASSTHQRRIDSNFIPAAANLNVNVAGENEVKKSIDVLPVCLRLAISQYGLTCLLVAADQMSRIDEEMVRFS